jgi:cold shock CspA family protein
MSSIRQTGRVKWFNNKSGYGFLTVCGSGDYKDKDIFAHFSSLNGEDNAYKYLVQGEYVEFDVVESKGEKHEFQAALITGVMGGDTMCDTHRLNTPPVRRARNNRDKSLPPTALTRQSNGDSDGDYNDDGGPRATKRY